MRTREIYRTSSLLQVCVILWALCDLGEGSGLHRGEGQTVLVGTNVHHTPSRLVGKLPALGWNTWNTYRCDINEEKVLDAAEDFVSLGLKDSGYIYVNIDDCWSNHTRDRKGRLQPDNERFPNGVAGVAEKIHELGLKVGIYSDAGTATCESYPGSLGNEAIDARTFADWGIDYLKYDNCFVPLSWKDSEDPPGGDWYNSKSSIRYRTMSEALVLQNRSIEFSLCIWGEANVWEWGRRVGHSWRILYDSEPTWKYITTVMRKNIELLDHVGFYSHNDMDMLEIGNGQLTIQEQRTHFAVWAFMKSPILLGTDLSTLSEEQLSIVKNKELLAFSQDSEFGAPAKPFNNRAVSLANASQNSEDALALPEYYAGESSAGMHVFIVNSLAKRSLKAVDFASVPGLKGQRFVVHDMWTNKTIGEVEGREVFEIIVEPHDTAALLVIPRLQA